MIPSDTSETDPLDFLERTVQQFGETYRGLLKQSVPVEYCQEAGKTFRDVFGHYCQTLVNVLDGVDEDELDNTYPEDEPRLDDEEEE